MQLLDWINTHDCGVTPTAIQNESGTITIRVSYVNTDGSTGIEETVVSNISEARDVLGY